MTADCKSTHLEPRFIYNVALRAAKREPNDTIKEKGFLCLALVALTSARLYAPKVMMFFMEQIKPNWLSVDLKMMSLHAIFDLVMLYGLRISQCIKLKPERLAETLTELLQMSRNVLVDEMRVLLCQGLVKLLHRDKRRYYRFARLSFLLFKLHRAPRTQATLNVLAE